MYISLLKNEANDTRNPLNRPYRASVQDKATARSTIDYHYPISPEGWALMDEWCNASYEEDGVVSGVLADWLEENAQHLLQGATGPDNLAGRLQQCVEWLRARCVNPVCAG